jgi:CheY-like chemotaxis protein
MIAADRVPAVETAFMTPFLLFGEDDAAQAALLAAACKRAGLRPSQFHVCPGGLEVIAHLEQAEPPEPRLPIPTRLITDFRMPLFDGIRVLLWVRGNRYFKDLPVTIISSEVEPRMQTRAELMGASDVLEKPGDFGGLVVLIRRWSLPAASAMVPTVEAAQRARKPR